MLQTNTSFLSPEVDHLVIKDLKGGKYIRQPGISRAPNSEGHS